MNAEVRKQQLREAQRRRREKLAGGERGQVNLFLTQQSKDYLDLWSLEFQSDKHAIVNALILFFAALPNKNEMGFELFKQTVILIDSKD